MLKVNFKKTLCNIYKYAFKVFFVLFVVLFCISNAPGADFPRKITDMSGRNVLILKKPKRIISLSPGVTEILYEIGAGDKIIAIDKASNYPTQAAGKPCIGDMLLDYEKIVILRPDIVIVDSNLRPQAARKLAGLNIKHIEVRAESFEEFEESVKIIAAATGNEEIAGKKIASLKAMINLISKSSAGKNRPRVFIEIWNNPLMAAGKDTFIDSIIKLSGGINLTGDLKGYPQISPETLLVRNPDIIILTTSSVKSFVSNPKWRYISAVKNGRVFYVNPDIISRPGFRSVEACREINRWLYP